MLKWSGRVIGGLLMLIGLTWLLQGLGLLGGSYMSGDMLWAGVGLGVILFALVLLFLSRIWTR